MQTSPIMARSEVDTTRPFKSVKEAVAVFGDRILSTNYSSSFKSNTIPNSPSIKTGANYANYTVNAPPQEDDNNNKPDGSLKLIRARSPSPPFCSPPSYASSVSNGSKETEHENENENENMVFNYLKRIELEVSETRKELVALKKRESEMEMALASMNAQLNRHLEKLSEVENVKEGEISVITGDKLPGKIRSDKWEEETVDSSLAHYEYLPSLAQALSLRDFGEEFYMGRKRKVHKMKPIVPLVGDIFTSKKKSSKENSSSLYSESFYSVLG